MAKPGSAQARQIAGGANLPHLLSDEQAWARQAEIELRLGTRCAGCGKRIDVGFQFTSIDPRDAQAPVLRLAACSREECGFGLEARKGATYVEAVEFVWMDDAGMDAPPADMSRGSAGARLSNA